MTADMERVLSCGLRSLRNAGPGSVLEDSEDRRVELADGTEESTIVNEVGEVLTLEHLPGRTDVST